MNGIDEILEKIKKIVDISFLTKIIISNPIKKGDGICKKINIEKIQLKGQGCFQLCYYIDDKVIHENITDEELILEKIIGLMEDNFKQCQILANNSFTILMSKKKQFKITGFKKSTNLVRQIKEHNKQRNYILKEGEYIDWLYKLNVMDKNGIVLSHMQKKFRQINKFLEMLKDVEHSLSQNAKIIDMGCGKSYLTFAMYYYFNDLNNKNIQIQGYDLKKDVVDNCNKLAEEFGFSGLKFYNEDIQNIDEKENINMIISLHACNTATDYAIYFGVKLGCEIILSVPCCQHEIFTQIKNEELKSFLDYGILKERFSALLTDSIRADILKLCGYKANIVEFIDMEHTPKNIMIKATKNKNFKRNEIKIADFERLMDNFSLSPTIYKLLKGYIK